MGANIWGGMERGHPLLCACAVMLYAYAYLRDMIDMMTITSAKYD